MALKRGGKDGGRETEGGEGRLGSIEEEEGTGGRTPARSEATSKSLLVVALCSTRSLLCFAPRSASPRAPQTRRWRLEKQSSWVGVEGSTVRVHIN